MPRSRLHQFAFVGRLTLLGIAGFWLLRSARHVTDAGGSGSSPTLFTGSTDRGAGEKAVVGKARRVAPFILADTTTDSPGTNLETRVVTFTAAVDGTPPVFLKWEVDHGNGFVPVSAGATNSVFKIPNAHETDTGRYALFATNAAGRLHTTPVPLVVVEGVD